MRRDRLRSVVTAGQWLLVVLGLAWALFERPAPIVTVRWRHGLSDDARRLAESRLQLENPQRSDEAWQYELWSPRHDDVEAIVSDPDVRDTGHINRGEMTVDDDAGRGSVRVWSVGPLRGPRGARQFRVLFAAIGVITLACVAFGRAHAHGVRPGSDRGQTRVKPGSDEGQTRV